MSTDTPEKDSYLVEEAQKLGAQKVEKPVGWDTTKTIGAVLGKNIQFYPNLPKIEWSQLIDKVFRILAIKIIDDWDNSKFSKSSSFPLLLIDLVDGSRYTTLGSGIAILHQTKKLIALKQLPVKVRLIMKPPDDPSGQPYYFLDDVI